MDSPIPRSQILLISKYPAILSSDPKKTILPKIEFFTSIGLSSTELTKLIVGSPGIWIWNLEKKIIPTFNFLKTLLPSNERTISAIKCISMVCGCDFEARMIHNIKVLRESGVPESYIVALLTQPPSVFATANNRFEKIVEEVKQMWGNPLKVRFVFAIHVLRSMSKSTWEKKVEFFEKWGWSEGDIYVAYEKQPSCMMALKIILSLSFEQRIDPWCSVYQVLLEKGLIRKKYSLSSLLEAPQKQFLDKITKCYKEAAPELLKLYQQKLEPSK